jgi:mono/diheme cytochrome c family protein
MTNFQKRSETGAKTDRYVLSGVPIASAALLAFWAFLAAPGDAAEIGTPPAVEQRALLDRYCSGCHNDKLRNGGISMTSLNVEDIGQSPEVWERVVRMVRTRYMPPLGLPRPDEKAYNALTAYLETSLDRVATAHPNPGRTDTLRRLNRTEYRNAVRDLLALNIDSAALLPQDDSSHGFDNITVGELPPTLLERYLSAAKKISRLAIGDAGRAPGGATFLLPPDLTQDSHFDELPLGTRGGTLVQYTFPENGTYEIQVRLMRDRNENVEGLTESAFLGVDADKLPTVREGAPHQLEVSLDGERLSLFTVVPPVPESKDSRYQQGGGHDLVDKDFNVRVQVKAGSHALAAAFLKHPTDLLETERQPYQAHFNFYRSPRIEPAVYSISVNGPFDPKGAGNTSSRQRIFVCRPETSSDEDACAQRIISNLARRAYRRPVTPADVAELFKLYHDGRTGSSFDAGIETAIRGLLVNPQVLFHIEKDPANAPAASIYQLPDLQIASRLAFFLWSSIPDEELLNLAEHGKLHDPAVLSQQVRRMLADQRSESLITSFADQWLYLRNLPSISPDPRVYPDFDDNLRQSLRQETELFFGSVVREDRNVLDLLRAKYTFLNERLARHYGIPNIYGSQFRRVVWPDDNPRRGLLGQGSILTVTSYSNRTSPVLRGKWVLANVLGTPPPPPPPNVPTLKDSGSATKVQTMRERMSQHRANPVCASCHRLMDPVGFSLENYDAVGQWRTEEAGLAVDASGSLPDGAKFDGPAGLETALLGRPEIFVTAVTEKLLTYGLGRGLEYYDAPSVRQIVRDAKNENYSFSSIVLGVIRSTPFENRRSQ